MALLSGLFLIALLGSRCTSATPPDVLVRERCTECHSLAPVEVQGRTFQQWESTVYRMVNLGARLNASESQRVIEYLTANYGRENQ